MPSSANVAEKGLMRRIKKRIWDGDWFAFRVYDNRDSVVMYLINVSVVCRNDPCILNDDGEPRIKFYGQLERYDLERGIYLVREIESLNDDDEPSIVTVVADTGVVIVPEDMLFNAVILVSGYWIKRGRVRAIGTKLVKESHWFSDDEFLDMLSTRIELCLSVAGSRSLPAQ
jgi:hypothetical protein